VDQPSRMPFQPDFSNPGLHYSLNPGISYYPWNFYGTPIRKEKRASAATDPILRRVPRFGRDGRLRILKTDIRDTDQE